MREFVFNSMELEVEGIAQQTEKKINKRKSSSPEGGRNSTPAADTAAPAAGVVNWEKFLCKMAVRVLLVEADDSTRQIIAALLRKCSYKVAAVSDGLKAWELLKSRPHKIDLILTEEELPSISGYALLSLITEHDVCKNIPVIMMSSHDSVSTVYKCMLRGAANFLVKPIRKNELKNMWQHVWRKQASNSGAGLGPMDESVAQQKVEATAENNATNNQSSGYTDCIKRNREGIEKGSDAQSSCTKPDLETERAEDSAKCNSDNINIPTHEEHDQESRITRPNSIEAGESRVEANVNSENNKVLENTPREAVDLIGAFDNYLKSTFGNSASNAGAIKFDISPVLDLSLKRSQHPSGSVNQINDEKQRLKHSDASAFSRYKNTPFPPSTSTSPITCNNQHKDQETNSEKQLSNRTLDYYSTTNGQTITSQRNISVPNFQPEITFSYPLQRNTSLPIPVKGVRFENIMNSYTSFMPPTLPSPRAPHHMESFPQMNPFYSSKNSISQQFHNHRISNAVEMSQNLEKINDDRGNIYRVNAPSGNSNICSGNVGQHHSIAVQVVNAASECGNEEQVNGESCNRYMQREAALMKFRLKRKDRCFDKKVRYESRKKLAEQRPRVKGQFVRQLPNDDHQHGNSSSG